MKSLLLMLTLHTNSDLVLAQNRPNAYDPNSSEHIKRLEPWRSTIITKTPRLQPWRTDLYRGDEADYRLPRRYRTQRGTLY